MLSDEDKQLWEQFTKGILHRRQRILEIEPKPRIRFKREAPHPTSPRIDLHGMTMDQAYKALESFISKAQSNGFKYVLVITGKGKSVPTDVRWNDESLSTLKREVPKWLANPPLKDKVTKVTPAKPQHGGEGAIYVYLRRIG